MCWGRTLHEGLWIGFSIGCLPTVGRQCQTKEQETSHNHKKYVAFVFSQKAVSLGKYFIVQVAADYKQHDCCGLAGYVTGRLLHWKEGSGVCSAGSASTFISIPWQQDQQSNSKSFLLAFHTTSLSPSYGGNRTNPQPVSTKIQFLLCFWGGHKASSKGWAKGPKHKELPAGTDANLVVWLQDSEGCRRVYCARALLLEIKSQLFSCTGFARAKCSWALFCIVSHGTSNKTERSSFVGVGVLYESLRSLCTCKSRFSSIFYVCLATHRVVP